MLGVMAPYQGHNDWALKLDLIDLEMSRAYFLGTKLSFNPFASVRVAFIDQKYDYGLRGLAPNVINQFEGTMRTDSWGIGPRIGVDTSWTLGKGFKILANAAGSILFTEYKASIYHIRRDNTTQEMTENFKFIRPNAEAALGLGWGRYFSNKSFYLDLSALYEFQIYWSQNMLAYTFNNFIISSSLGQGPSTFSSAIGDLQIHGLTITARFDF